MQPPVPLAVFALKKHSSRLPLCTNTGSCTCQARTQHFCPNPVQIPVVFHNQAISKTQQKPRITGERFTFCYLCFYP